jgi:hypothetical protein
VYKGENQIDNLVSIQVSRGPKNFFALGREAERLWTTSPSSSKSILDLLPRSGTQSQDTGDSSSILSLSKNMHQSLQSISPFRNHTGMP